MRFFIYLILAIWFIIALGRTLYNFSKVYTEDRQWITVSDDTKRLKIFGDLYTYTQFIDKNTTNKSSILSEYMDDRTYYYGRYSLFPKTFVNYVSSRETEKKLINNRYDYFATNTLNNTITKSLIAFNYKLQKTLSIKGKTFFLYKKNE